MGWIQVACRQEIHGDGSQGDLLQQDARGDFSRWAGQAACVYLDPPFMTGEDFFLRMRVGEKGWETGKDSLLLPNSAHPRWGCPESQPRADSAHPQRGHPASQPVADSASPRQLLCPAVRRHPEQLHRQLTRDRNLRKATRQTMQRETFSSFFCNS